MTNKKTEEKTREFNLINKYTLFLFALILPLYLLSDCKKRCDIGSLDCECTTGRGCDPDLVCTDKNLCVSPVPVCACNATSDCDPECAANGDGGADGMGAAVLPACRLQEDACWLPCIANKTPVADCAKVCPIQNAVGCYKLCQATETPLGQCKATCGLPTPASERSCYEVGLRIGLDGGSPDGGSPDAGASLDDSGIPDIAVLPTATVKSICGTESSCAEVGCSLACIKNMTSSALCKSTCNFATEAGQEACFNVCAATNVATATCRNTCGTTTPCGQLGCYNLAAKVGTTLSSSINICALDNPCAQLGCYEVCIANKTPTASCRSICGITEILCNGCSKIAESPRSACYRLCITNSTSPSTCASICNS